MNKFSSLYWFCFISPNLAFCQRNCQAQLYIFGKSLQQNSLNVFIVIYNYIRIFKVVPALIYPSLASVIRNSFSVGVQ